MNVFYLIVGKSTLFELSKDKTHANDVNF